MRSAAVVMAAEYVAAGGERGRSVIARALQRPDEPAEMLGYWLQTRGRNVPMPVKRGIADAVRRLYTERAALRYDGVSRRIRMADVIELTSYHLRLNELLPVFIEVKEEFFSAPYPAWTAVGVAELGVPGALVEVKALARLG